MIDDLRSDDGLGGVPGPARTPRPQPGSRPMVDREVPLGQTDSEARVLAPALHAWLDGELPEASARRGEITRDVDFWKRIADESERRRRVRTPAYVEAQIMAALPQTTPALITPWWRRELVVTPTTAAVAMMGVAMLTAVATALMMSAR